MQRTATKKTSWQHTVAMNVALVGLLEYLSYKLVGYGFLLPTLKEVGLWLLGILSVPL